MPALPPAGLSYTQARSFRTCRRQYWFAWLSGEPWPADTPGVAALIGIGVHRALRVLGETDDPRMGLGEALRFARMPGHAGLIGEGAPAHDTLLELYEAGVEAHHQIGGDPAERLVEKQTAAPSTDRSFLLLQARLDRADLLADGSWQVTDWKTGQYETEEETDGQLDIAHAAFRIVRPRLADVPVRVVAWNLRTSTRRERVLGPADAADVVAIFEALAGRIAANRDWEPEPGGHCTFCRWAPRCPAQARRGSIARSNASGDD